jgi:hypothetical protein
LILESIDDVWCILESIDPDKSQEIASSSIVSNYDDPTSEDNVTVTKPNPETQVENLQSVEVMEDTENMKSHGALAGGSSGRKCRN